MATISPLGAFPDPSTLLQRGSANTGTAGRTPSTAKPIVDETEASPLQSQLTRLSNVLNGLQASATSNRTQYVDTLNQIRAGSYQVDSAAVSRSMIDDALADS